jgi:hypothetical protein
MHTCMLACLLACLHRPSPSSIHPTPPLPQPAPPGRNRPKKQERTPEQRQATIKEALRFASAELSGASAEPGGAAARLHASPSWAAGSAASGQVPWWKRQFQALWLPNLRYADGSKGFVQLDVSLTEGV